MAILAETFDLYLSGWLAMGYPRESAVELAAKCTASDTWHERADTPEDCNPEKCDCEADWRSFLP